MAAKKKASKSAADAVPSKPAAAPAKPGAKKPSPKPPAKPAPLPPPPPPTKAAAKATPAAQKPPAPPVPPALPAKVIPVAKPAVLPPAKPAKEPAPKKEAAKQEAGKQEAAKQDAAKKPAAPPPKAKPAPPVKAAGRARAASLDDVDEPDEDDLEKEDDDEEDEEEEAEERAEEPTAEDDGEEAPRAAVKAPDEEEEAPPPPKPVIRRAVPPLPPRKPGVITVAFSPDADDAFMLYGIVSGKVDTEDRKYEFVRSDIASLNAESQKGTYDVTAFSYAAWPKVVDRYLALPSGGSFGDQTGPVVVSKTPVRSGEVNGLSVAVPGRSTTATMVLKMWLHPNKLNLIEVPFQQVALAVKSGQARAGLLIHEGQLTYKADGLTRVMDLGLWWGERTEGLPLPLGGTAVRRDIAPEERAKIALDLKRSIAFALGHRELALDYAMPFGRGLARPLLDKYIATYVSELTLDYGERGRQAVRTLFDEAQRLGHLPDRVDLEFA